jgi:hypothetical protein
MKQLTVTELRKLLQKAEREGLGDRLVITSNDVEENGYHGLWYGVTQGEELTDGFWTVDIEESETTDITKLVCIT